MAGPFLAGPVRAVRQVAGGARIDSGSRTSSRPFRCTRMQPAPVKARAQEPGSDTVDVRRISCPRTALIHSIGISTTAAAAAATLLLSAPGAVLAEAQEAQLPSLPTPPEIVQNLSTSLMDSLSSDEAQREAPPLKDSKSADAKQNSQKQEEEKADTELQKRMEDFILPKIQEQLQGLDQNENPNSTTIELKRQLRRAEDDIYRLLDDLKERKSGPAHAEANGLQRELEEIRKFVVENGGELADEVKS